MRYTVVKSKKEKISKMIMGLLIIRHDRVYMLIFNLPNRDSNAGPLAFQAVLEDFGFARSENHLLRSVLMLLARYMRALTPLDH
jgi:hypothetical protein